MLLSINEKGPVKDLGIKFVDHMISNLGVEGREKKAKILFSLLTKLVKSGAGLTPVQTSNIHRSYVELMQKSPALVQGINQLETVSHYVDSLLQVIRDESL